MTEFLPGIYKVLQKTDRGNTTEINIFIIPGKKGERSLMIDAGFQDENCLAQMEGVLKELDISYEDLDVFLPINIMTIQDRRAVMDQCFTEKYGTYQCMLRAREALTQRFGRTVPDTVIDEVLRNGDADIGRDYVDTIREVAAGYAAEIMRRLREHEYDPQTMRLWIVGGGGCLLRHFGEYECDRVTIIDNIHANAEGYEYLAERRLKREGAAG